MSQRELCIVLAHAIQCEACRTRFLRDPAGIWTGRALSSEEKDLLAKLTAESFRSPDHLAEATGLTQELLSQYGDHPVVRLRHF